MTQLLCGSYVRYNFDSSWVQPPGRYTVGGRRVHRDGYSLYDGDRVLVLSEPAYHHDEVTFIALMKDGNARWTTWQLNEIGDP